MKRRKSKGLKLRDPIPGSQIGKYNDVLINVYHKLTPKGRVKTWAIVECSQCGMEYDKRLSSILAGQVYCKCRKEKLSIKNKLKYKP